MSGVNFGGRGDFKKTEKFLIKSIGQDWKRVLDKYGAEGVSALSAATPKETGETSASWSYEIIQNGSSVSVVWNNSHIENGYANIAILLQYGHGTRNGGYVSGRDYINPAIQPIFDKMAEAAWKEVISNV